MPQGPAQETNLQQDTAGNYPTEDRAGQKAAQRELTNVPQDAMWTNMLQDAGLANTQLCRTCAEGANMPQRLKRASMPQAAAQKFHRALCGQQRHRTLRR